MDGNGATGIVRRRTRIEHLDALEQLAAAQREADVQHMRTRPGPFSMRIIAVDFGPLRVQSLAVTNSYLVRGVLRGSFHGMLLPDRTGPTSRLNGGAIGNDDAVALRAGSEMDSHVMAGQRWMALTFDPMVFAETLEPLALDTRDRVTARGLQAASPGLRPWLAGLAGVAAAAPECLDAPAVAQAVVDEAQRLLAAGIRGAAAEPVAPADRTRLRLFRAAVDYLETVLDRPVYSAGVGAALGAEVRAVNGAFRAVHGITLHHYLHIRRLALARERLAGGVAAPRVKTVALDLGFWHLGRFSRAYAGLFGEAPSQTLARARGRAA